MIADPQTVTISAVPYTLARVSTDANSGRFATGDGAISEAVSHSYGKRVRRMWRLVHSKYAPDPLFPAQNLPYSMSYYIVADVPVVGYTVAEQKAVVDGFNTQLAASSGALITKFLGGEN